MDFTLSESQTAVRNEALQFARNQLATGHLDPVFDRDGWDKCAALGAMGVTIPEQYGGRGQSLNEFVALMEGLGTGAPERLGLFIAINAHVFGSVETIHKAGTDAQKDRYLPNLASGKWVAAHSVTEPDAGSDISGLKTSARKDGDHWIINGVKRYTTCGAGADLHVVYARMGDPARFRLSCFIVDPDTPGMHVRPLATTGLQGSGLSEVTYDEVRVAEDSILGRPGAGAMLFQGSIERERACVLGYALGAMERQLELSINYANERRVGDKSIGSFQAVSHRIAEMKVRLDISRMLLYKVAAIKSAGRRAPMDSAEAKLYISEAFLQNSIDASRIHGGNGFVTEGEIERYVRDALGSIIYSGTSDIQRNIIAAQAGVRV